MSRFRNARTGLVVTVDDSKDGRFSDGWERVDVKAAHRPPAKKSTKH